MSEIRNTALVSIIIPSYNVERYLARAIESALSQTYGDVEVIVVDDGSTDGTLEVARTFYDDPRLMVHAQSNLGVSAARNAALDNAHGDYCIFLDADDWLAKRAVETLLRETAAHPGELVCCGREMVEEGPDGVLRVVDRMEPPRGLTVSSREARMQFGKRSAFNPHNVFYTIFDMGIVRENNLRFLEGVTNKEDGLFMMEYLGCVDRVRAIPDVLWHMFQRRGSATRVTFDARWESGLRAYDALASLLADDDELEGIIARERAGYLRFLMMRGRGVSMGDDQYRRLQEDLRAVALRDIRGASLSLCADILALKLFPVGIARGYLGIREVLSGTLGRARKWLRS